MSRRECRRILLAHEESFPNARLTLVLAEEIQRIVGELPYETTLTQLHDELVQVHVRGMDLEYSPWQAFCQELDVIQVQTLVQLLLRIEEQNEMEKIQLGQVRQKYWEDFTRRGFGPHTVERVPAAFFWYAFGQETCTSRCIIILRVYARSVRNAVLTVEVADQLHTVARRMPGSTPMKAFRYPDELRSTSVEGAEWFDLWTELDPATKSAITGRLRRHINDQSLAEMRFADWQDRKGRGVDEVGAAFLWLVFSRR